MRTRTSIHCLAAVLALAGLVACESQSSDVCNGGPTTGNSTAPPAFPIELGQRSGTFRFYYETRKARDRVQVRYEGVELFDSGCVGETRTVALRYGPGQATHVDVVLTPNCGGTAMTSWLFEVGCPVSGLGPRRGGEAAPAPVQSPTSFKTADDDPAPPRRRAF